MATTRLSGALVILMAAAVGVGCSADTDGDPSPADVKEQIRQVTQADLAGPGPAGQVDEQEQHSRRLTETLTRCMVSAGFEFVTYRPPPPPRVSLGLSDKEFAARYGWGISTLIDYQVPGAQNVDPNAAIRARLSPEAQRAYDKQVQACWRQAFEKVGPAPGAYLERKASEELQAIQRRANADPRIARAKRAYGDCMARQGFQASSGDGIQGEINAQIAEFRQRYEAERNALVVRGQSVSGLRLADLLTPGERARLRAIQQREIKAAVADQTCGELLYPVVREVHREYIQRYLDGGG